VRVENVGGGHKRISGIDAVTNKVCSIITKGDFQDWAPTFIKIVRPHRLHCELDQAVVRSSDDIERLRAKGWFGAYSVAEARVAKGALAGRPEDMVAVAVDRSFRFLRSKDSLPNVERWADPAAAGYWFSAAAQQGIEAAELGRAYLQDLMERGSKATPPVNKKQFIDQAMSVAKRYRATMNFAHRQQRRFGYRLKIILFAYIEELRTQMKQHRPRHLGRAASALIDRWQKEIESR
jgi:hypothetical protein